MARFTHAMILAAGRGKRMRPLTDTLPKPMLSVGGQPLIEYHLHKLKAAGVEIVVINHAWLGAAMQQALGDGSRFGVKIIWSAEPEGGLETAGGIVRALPHLGGADFIVVNGDVWSDYDYRLLPLLDASRDGHLVLVDNPEHHHQGDFAIEQERLVFAQGQRESLTFAGISVLHTRLFHGLDDSFHKLRPVFERAIVAQRLYAEHYQGHWCDVGTPERLKALDAWITAREANAKGSLCGDA